ncbi:MAG: helix-hairpin-helix domain-containing protein [Anaerolineae bacterium]|nr:helix-hairpin-helix domain-containing protein [Anaerolineae bacterium]
MDVALKLESVASQMHLEPAEEKQVVVDDAPQIAPCGITVGKQAKRESLGIYNAAMPGGKTIPLLKTMLTTACERNCAYCPFRAGRNYRRTTFKPEEMAKTFHQMEQAGMVQGLFLSSGIIKGSIVTQDKLLETVEIIRKRYRFNGYIHLKVMPGAEKAQLERAMQLTDRLSVNLEGPTEQRLATLAPMKQLSAELIRPLQLIEEIRRTQPAYTGWKRRWPSTATQFVVGAVGDTDLELLQATDYLYHRLQLRRTYFSAFSPIRDTPLESVAATPPIREARLYQASFLLRDYAFDLEELPFSADGNLPHEVDPKMAWANVHLQDEPVELNHAERRQLLRVPGIGPWSADRIMEARRAGKLRDLRDLQQLGLKTKRMERFVLLDGHRPNHQLRFF